MRLSGSWSFPFVNVAARPDPGDIEDVAFDLDNHFPIADPNPERVEPMQARHVNSWGLWRLGVVGDGPDRGPDGGGLPRLHPRKGLYGALVNDCFHVLLSRIAIN